MVLDLYSSNHNQTPAKLDIRDGVNVRQTRQLIHVQKGFSLVTLKIKTYFLKCNQLKDKSNLSWNEKSAFVYLPSESRIPKLQKMSSVKSFTVSRQAQQQSPRRVGLSELSSFLFFIFCICVSKTGSPTYYQHIFLCSSFWQALYCFLSAGLRFIVLLMFCNFKSYENYILTPPWCDFTR